MPAGRGPDGGRARRPTTWPPIPCAVPATCWRRCGPSPATCAPGGLPFTLTSMTRSDGATAAALPARVVAGGRERGPRGPVERGRACGDRGGLGQCPGHGKRGRAPRVPCRLRGDRPRPGCRIRPAPASTRPGSACGGPSRSASLSAAGRRRSGPGRRGHRGVPVLARAGRPAAGSRSWPAERGPRPGGPAVVTPREVARDTVEIRADPPGQGARGGHAVPGAGPGAGQFA